MIRKFGRTQDFVPVVKLTDTRYRINFDYVAYPEDNNYGYWTVVNYFSAPTTEQIQEDVKRFTKERYERDGLEYTDANVEDYII